MYPGFRRRDRNSPIFPRNYRPLVEALETRCLPATTVYLDFGASFPVSGLGMTVAQLRDDLHGPNLTADGLADTDTLTFTPLAAAVTFDYNGDSTINAADAADLQNAIVSLVQRYFAPFDVTVTTASASSFTDITNTLAANAGNASGQFDAYVLVDSVSASPGTLGAGIFGRAGLSDSGAANTHDDNAVVFANNLFSSGYNNATADTAIAFTAAHQAGLTFGLQQTVSDDGNPGTSDVELLDQSDLMAADPASVQRQNLDFFTRYPLALTEGTQNAFDRLADDADIGLRAGAPAFVTGTGAFDRITLTKLGDTQATVSVQPFRAATFAAADAIGAPFTYTIDLANGVLVEAGFGEDQIVVDGSLGGSVAVRGMAGNDQLIVNGGGASGLYLPAGTTTPGLDGHTSFTGAVQGGATTVSFEEFETAGSIAVQSFLDFTVRTPNSADVLNVAAPSGTENQVSGTSGGIGLVPLTFSQVKSFAIDAASNDVGSADQVTIGSGGLVAISLKYLEINTGLGVDSLIVQTGNFSLPVAGGAFTYNAGAETTDRIEVTADVNFTLSDAELASSGGGTIVFNSSVEVANLTGGDGNNSFDVSGWSGSGTMDGQGGTGDIIQATNDVNFILTNSSLQRTGLPALTLANIEIANLTGGADNNSFDVSGWTGSGIMDGQGGTGDIIQATNDVNFILTNSSLQRSAMPALSLANIEIANLTGGDGNNSFDVSGWSGSGTMDGQAGTGDIIQATNDVNFVLTNSSLQRSALPALSLANIEIANLTGGDGNNSFDVSGWSSSGTMDGQSGTGDIIQASNDVNFILTNSSLQRSAMPALSLANIEIANLTGGDGNNSFDVSGWSGSGTMDGQAGTGDIIQATNDVNFVLTNSSLQRSTLPALSLANIEIANLTGGDSNNSFDVSGWSGSGTMDGQGGTGDAIVASNDVNFVLANASLQRTGLPALTLANIEVANLTGGVGNNSFDVSGWTGSGTMDGQGGTGDIMQATNDVNFVLTNASLQRTGLPALSLANIEVANLTGGDGNNSFGVSGWSGSGTMDGQAGTGDIIQATNDVNFVLTNSSLQRSALPALTLANIEIANLTGGDGNNSFNVSGWTGSGTMDGQGGTGDIIQATNDVNFMLTNSSLQRSALPALTLANIEIANLTGGDGNNSFNVSGWSGSGTMDGQGGTGDAIVASNDVNFILTNASLQRTGLPTLTLANIEVANLTGGVGNNSFDVSGWSGSGTMDGQGGTGDAIVASNDVNFVLANASLQRTGLPALTLANIEVANLTGGVGNNSFDVSGWTGSGTMDGQGGTGDIIQATNDVNFVLANASLQRTGSPALTLANIEIANLTGGAGDNAMTVLSWTGTANLDGKQGADTYNVTFVGAGSGQTNIHDTGTSGGDALTVQGTAGGDHLVVTFNQVTRGTEGVTATGVETRSVQAGAGKDQIDVNVTPDHLFDVTVVGGADADQLNVTDLSQTAVVHDIKIPPPDDAPVVELCYLDPNNPDNRFHANVVYRDVETVVTSPTPEQSFVQALFRKALRRNATPAELAHWVAVEKGPGGRLAVVRGVEFLPEALNVEVTSWFVQFLGHPPGKGQAKPLVALLKQGQTEERVLSQFFNRTDYYNGAGGSQQGFVNLIFRQLLGRLPRSNESTSALQGILPTTGRGGLALALLSSAEYRIRVVRVYFRRILDRDTAPTAAEINAYALSKTDLRSIRIRLEAGDEFFNRAC